CSPICTVSYYSTLLLLTHLYCVSVAGKWSNSPLVPAVGAGIGVVLILLGSIIYLKKKSKTPRTEHKRDPPDEITYADINHRARRTQGENEQNEQTTPMGASDDTVYSNVNHKRPKKQEATAPRATQEEPSCVYAEVRRKQ
ncbi:hypothetical protein JZ751_012903, partial [Albula glossodonta]